VKPRGEEPGQISAEKLKETGGKLEIARIANPRSPVFEKFDAEGKKGSQGF
jgi:hypothetical protein